jgi:hypothetical protein
MLRASGHLGTNLRADLQGVAVLLLLLPPLHYVIHDDSHCPVDRNPSFDSLALFAPNYSPTHKAWSCCHIT